MAQAKDGDNVKIHYTGKLEDGTVFDSSKEGEPLEFQLGQGQLIPGFEKAVLGMEVGKSKTVEIPVDEAYGPHREELIMVVGRSEFPEDVDPKVGDQLRMQQQDGAEFLVMVTAASEADVTLDGNHPLAGKDLTFELELVEIA